MAKNASGGHKAGKKNRKHKRCIESPSHKRYLIEGRQEKNKAKKQLKHKTSHPNSVVKLPVDYKIKKLRPDEQQEIRRQIQWKQYIKGRI